MQTTNWTEDPVLRELLGLASYADAEIPRRESDTALEDAASPKAERPHQPRDSKPGMIAMLDEAIHKGLRQLLNHIVESFAAYGCAMSCGYHDAEAMLAAHKAQTPVPSSACPVLAPPLREETHRFCQHWRH